MVQAAIPRAPTWPPGIRVPCRPASSAGDGYPRVTRRDHFTVRNKWWRDQRGERSGYATSYSSHTIGFSHQFNDLIMIRPEIGFYHSYDVPAFNLGTTKNLLMYGFDFTVRS